MSVAEMKQKVIVLMDKAENERKIEKLIKVLTEPELNYFSPDEAFERTSKKYSTTLQKLAQ